MTPPHETLEREAERLARTVPRGYVLPGSGRRYTRLDVGGLVAHLDAWLIAWPPDTGLPMHDHDGSSAVLRVVRSALRERYVDGGHLVERVLATGDRVHLDPDHVHEVVNVSRLEALSIHVYTPRLTTVRFRDEFALWRPAVASPLR
jgi:Cysteine dioxygenase type I